MTHHHCIDRQFQSDNLKDYEREVKSLYAHGGNNFLTAFERIRDIIKQNPGLEELVIIFVTDGHDCMDCYEHPRGQYAQDLLNVAKQIKEVAGLKTSYMCIGFSEGHDARQMNQIANFGSAPGNFMYVPTNVADYQ